MKSNQVSVVGIILVALAAILVATWSFPALAFESRYGGHAITSADQYAKDFHSPGIQLIASSRATKVHQGSGVTDTGSGGNSTTTGGGSTTSSPSKNKIGIRTPQQVCYNQCIASDGCQRTDHTCRANAMLKCTQQCVPRAK